MVLHLLSAIFIVVYTDSVVYTVVYTDSALLFKKNGAWKKLINKKKNGACFISGGGTLVWSTGD